MIRIYNIITPTEKLVSPIINNISVEGDSKNFTIEIIDSAAHSTELLPVDIEHHRNEFGFQLSNSEINNFRSHHYTWNRFLETDSELCLIVENHLSISLNIDSILSDLACLSMDWDMYIPYDVEGILTFKGKSTTLNPNIREIGELEPYYLGRKIGNCIYFLTRKGSERLLTIETIEYRLDGEILRMIELSKIKCLFGETSWMDAKDALSFEFDERRLNLWKYVNVNTPWDSKSYRKVRKLLKVVSEIGKKLGIDLILQGGTHLGYIRHGGIMPWDDDIDIGIDRENLDSFMLEIKNYSFLSIDKFLESHTDTYYYKIWLDDGEIINSYKYTFPFIDLWIFNIRNNDLVFDNGIVCPNSAKEPFEEIFFEEAIYHIPKNSLDVLDTRYKDWRKRIRVYHWSHRLEAPFHYPLSIEINTDIHSGKMVGLKGNS